MTAADIARTYFDSITNGNVEEALSQFAPDATFVAPFGALPFPDGVRAYLEGYDQSFKGHGFRITRAVEQGEEVAVEGTWYGTHSGPMTFPDGSHLQATGKSIEAPFVTMLTVRSGKISSHRGYWDMAGFMSQLQG